MSAITPWQLSVYALIALVCVLAVTAVLGSGQSATGTPDGRTADGNGADGNAADGNAVHSSAVHSSATDRTADEDAADGEPPGAAQTGPDSAAEAGR
jgi:hypothetical protein